MSAFLTPNSGVGGDKVNSVQSPTSASSTGGGGLFRRDLMAKSRTEFLNDNTKPYLIVAGDSTSATRWYESSEESLFFDHLKELFMSGNGNIWVDIDFSGIPEVRFKHLCQEILCLHDLTARDCFIEDRTVTDTKVSLFPEYLFCIVDTLAAQGLDRTDLVIKGDREIDLETKNLNIILFKAATVSMHNGPISGPSEVFSRVVDGHKGKIPSPAWILWGLFDTLTESLNGLINVSVNLVESIDYKSVPVDPDHRIDQSQILREMRSARKQLGKLRGSLSSKIELLSKLISEYPQMKSMKVHLKGLQAEVKWKMERVVFAQETLQAAYQNYLAFISVQAANVSNQANGVLKKITLLLAFTTPLNLIVSIMGMNVYPLNQVSIGNGVDEGYQLFAALLVVMLLLSLALFLAAKCNKWI